MSRLRSKWRPLHWLTFPPRWQKWLLSGWEALDVAAVLGDRATIATQSRDYTTQITLDWERYSRRIGFLTREDAAVAADLGYDWQEFSQYIHQSLARASLREDLDVPCGGRLLARWAERALGSLGMSNKAASAHLRDPVAMFRFGYECLRAKRGALKLPMHVSLHGLILIGIASSGVLQKQRCRFCFRWAEPAQVFCPVHSQSKKYESERVTKARNYFIGRRTAQSLNWLASPPKLHVYSDVAQAAIVMAHSLWGSPPSWAGKDAVIDEIRGALASAPTVSKMLKYSDTVADTTLELRLRKKLDSLELWIDAWPEKIRLAEQWFTAEKLAIPGGRGRSEKTSDRIACAEKMAMAGKTVADIGQSLGVSRSSISKWCSRGRAPKLKKLLEDSRSRK